MSGLSSIARPRVRASGNRPDLFLPGSGTARSYSGRRHCGTAGTGAGRHRPVEQGLQLAVKLDAPVFADAQEDDPVDGHLDGVVQVALAEGGVAQGDVVRQQVAPALDLGQEGVDPLRRCHACRWRSRRTGRTSL